MAQNIATTTNTNPLLPNITNTNVATGQSASSGGDTPNAGFATSPLTASIGAKAGPINQEQQAALFVLPGQANVQNLLQGGFNLQNAGNYANAPLVSSSPLAGLTTLGNVTNAGTNQINTTGSNALAAGQLAQINQLNALAQGQGPSAAAIQAQQTGQQNVANEMAMIASQRGAASPALGLQQAQNSIAQTNQQAVQAATLGRTQEQLAAQGQLTSALGTAQGQTMQGAQAQASLNQAVGLQNASAANTANLAQGQLVQQTNLANQGVLQQTNLANQTAQAQAQSLNAQEYNAMLQAQQNQYGNILTGQENYGNLVTNENTAVQGIGANLAMNQGNNMMGLVGAGISAAGGVVGGLLAGSDINLKTNIKSATRDMKTFLTHIAKAAPQSQFALLEAI